MKLERATALMEELLRRVVAGGWLAELARQVWVFGSYARGALESGDVNDCGSRLSLAVFESACRE